MQALKQNISYIGNKCISAIVTIAKSIRGLVLLKKSRNQSDIDDHHISSSLADIYRTRPKKTNDEYPAECIIFSMDRAFQLHALLGSYYEKVKYSVPVHVLYRASSGNHEKAYKDIFTLFGEKKISPIRQQSRRSFRNQVLSLLESLKAERIFFLVDDIVFTEDLDLSDFAKFNTEAFIPALRMGANLKRAYTVQKRQKLPQFIPNAVQDRDKLCWVWEKGELDWAYPLSVDGHLFSRREILVLARHTPFNSPNTFEANLQRYSKYFLRRYGICYKKSKIINIPINRVQRDYENIHGQIHQDYLLEQWNRGFQMDYRALYGFTNESVHQEISINFIKREDYSGD